VFLFRVGGLTFAIAANALDEIRNVEGLRPLVQPLVPKVRHVFERAARTYYVVDAGFYFHMLPVRSTHLLILRGHNVALLVERIDLMKQIPAVYALPRAFTGEERRWYRGLAVLPGSRTDEESEIVPVVNPDALLSPEEMGLLAPLLRARGARA
jgi:hypothetical protein